MLQDAGNSFHLEAQGDNKWKLYPVYHRGARGKLLVIPVNQPLDKETLRRFDRLEAQTRRPVTTSQPHSYDFPPELAVGGVRTPKSSWQTNPYPAPLTADLESAKMLKAVHVWPYWGQGRYYQYTVEVSKDGETWSQVGDMSKNSKPSTPAGNRLEFERTEARHIRVNMLYHNLNKSVHIFEIGAFE